MDLKWRIKPWGEATLVELEGEVDLHSAPPLKAALLEVGSAQSARIALDLNGVSFLDSTGIGALVGVYKKTREGKGQIVFFGARPRVKRVFQIAGLWNALPFYESRDAALAVLLPAPLVTLPETPVPAEGEAHAG
ncbi:anti-sigma-B factor antagonist [Abditibacteriota bacterium]|nr:anti-sigma-B factor antagonist [Abditibacteriota bacterium]